MAYGHMPSFVFFAKTRHGPRKSDCFFTGRTPRPLFRTLMAPSMFVMQCFRSTVMRTWHQITGTTNAFLLCLFFSSTSPTMHTSSANDAAVGPKGSPPTPQQRQAPTIIIKKGRAQQQRLAHHRHRPSAGEGYTTTKVRGETMTTTQSNLEASDVESHFLISSSFVIIYK